MVGCSGDNQTERGLICNDIRRELTFTPRPPLTPQNNSMTTQSSAADVRGNLLDALRLDLVGPEPGLGNSLEVLKQFPSCWYLTGFLVPSEASEEQKNDDEGDDELEDAGESGSPDDGEPDKPSARRVSFPSSMGISVLVPADSKTLNVTVQGGDYKLQLPDEELGTRHAAVTGSLVRNFSCFGKSGFQHTDKKPT